MNIKEYSIEVGRQIDKFYLPPELDKQEETVVKLIEQITSDMFDYFDRNIAPEMAAEFIASNLGLIRDPNTQN